MRRGSRRRRRRRPTSFGMRQWIKHKIKIIHKERHEAINLFVLLIVVVGFPFAPASASILPNLAPEKVARVRSLFSSLRKLFPTSAATSTDILHNERRGRRLALPLLFWNGDRPGFFLAHTSTQRRRRRRRLTVWWKTMFELYRHNGPLLLLNRSEASMDGAGAWGDFFGFYWDNCVYNRQMGSF